MDNNYSTRSVSEWIGTLSNPDKEQRAGATAALISYGEESLPALLDVLTHTDWRVRYRAAEAIGKIGSVSSLHTDLVSALIARTNDEKDHVRYMAAKGLVQMQDPHCKKVFQKLLNDEHSYTRAVAEKGLAVLEGQQK